MAALKPANQPTACPVSAIGVLAAAVLATLVMRNTKPQRAPAATAAEHEQPELVA